MIATPSRLTLFADRPTQQVPFAPLPPPNVVARTTDSGLTVYVSRSGDQTRDAPLPCTPYFEPRLALRRPGDPWSGFVVTPRRE